MQNTLENTEFREFFARSSLFLLDRGRAKKIQCVKTVVQMCDRRLIDDRREIPWEKQVQLEDSLVFLKQEAILVAFKEDIQEMLRNELPINNLNAAQLWASQ